MTQTIRTAKGRKAVWIEADLGQGNRGRPRLVQWYKVTLEEFLEDYYMFYDLGMEQAKDITKTLLKFKGGFAWYVDDEFEGEFFSTEKEARDWAWSQHC